MMGDGEERVQENVFFWQRGSLKFVMPRMLGPGHFSARRFLLVFALLALAAAAVDATQARTVTPDVDAPAESVERENVGTEKQVNIAGKEESPVARADTPATDSPNPDDGGVLDGMETADVPFTSKKKEVANRMLEGKPDDDDGDDDPEETKKTGAGIHYCRHIAACGRRPFLLRGPQSTDSNHDGLTCYCRGPKQAKHSPNSQSTAPGGRCW